MARSTSNKTRVSPPVQSQLIRPAHLRGHVLICFYLLQKYHASILFVNVVDRPHALYWTLIVIVTLECFKLLIEPPTAVKSKNTEVTCRQTRGDLTRVLLLMLRATSASPAWHALGESGTRCLCVWVVIIIRWHFRCHRFFHRMPVTVPGNVPVNVPVQQPVQQLTPEHVVSVPALVFRLDIDNDMPLTQVCESHVSCIAAIATYEPANQTNNQTFDSCPSDENNGPAELNKGSLRQAFCEHAHY